MQARTVDKSTSKIERAPPETEALPVPPPDPVCLSVLWWDGEPIKRNVEQNDMESYGQYIHAIPPSTDLSPTSWSTQHNAFTYKPSRAEPVWFTYTRTTFIGTTPAETTIIYGDVTAQDPLLLVHRLNAASRLDVFRATFDPPGGDGQAARLQPPFSFETLQNVEIAPADPARGKLMRVSLPDLAMHRAAMEGVGAESEEDEAHPGLPEGNFDRKGMFHGDWSRRFIKRAQAREELEPLEKTVWDRSRVCGVRLKLEPILHSVVKSRIYFENEPADAGGMEYIGLRKTRLEGYRVKATIVEVYIARSFFQEFTGDIEAVPEA